MSNKHLRGIVTISGLFLKYWRCPSEKMTWRLQTRRSSDRAAAGNCARSETKSVKQQLLRKVADHPVSHSSKVTVVGIGQVGMACAVSLLMQNITKELVLVDKEAEKIKGEMLDLRHGSVFMQNAMIFAGTDYSVSADSRLVVVTAGVRQKKKETRLDLVQRNAEVLRAVVPQVVKHSPKCILLIVSNPVDVLTYAAWRLSGLPRHRVIGTGTSLDSSRFRYYISERLGVRPGSVHSWVIGEHGNSSVPVWSGVNVAGVRLRELNPAMGTAEDKENWAEVHKKVVESAYKVRMLKGYTSWAIGLSAASLAESVIKNAGKIHAVCTAAQGYHGIDKDVFLSLPCMLNENGVSYVVQHQLTEEEMCQLRKSADIIYEVQKDLKL